MHIDIWSGQMLLKEWLCECDHAAGALVWLLIVLNHANCAEKLWSSVNITGNENGNSDIAFLFCFLQIF